VKVLIAGGGIGGLSAALCLHRAGHEVSVFERTPERGEIGAGIQLGANAVRVLDSLGLRGAFEKVVVRPDAIRFRLYDSGETLLETPLGQAYEDRYGAPYYHVHRADIHAILADAFEAASPGSIHLASEAVGFEERADGVSLRLKGGRSVDGDCLVGADGLKSATRDQIVGAAPCNWTGNVAWRGTVVTSRLPAGFMDKIVSNFVGPRKHVVIYYLRRQELVNFVGVVENDAWRDESWTVKAPWKELKADYSGWHETVQAVIDAMDEDECYRWALFNRLPMDNWSTDRVTLLGDAAHATLPFMASGAAMAIEDARVLTRALEQAGSVGAGLRLYQRNRLERTARIQTTSTAMGQLYHQPDADAFRKGFTRAQEARSRSDEDRNAWLASYDPNTVKLV